MHELDAWINQSFNKSVNIPYFYSLGRKRRRTTRKEWPKERLQRTNKRNQRMKPQNCLHSHLIHDPSPQNGKSYLTHAADQSDLTNNPEQKACSLHEAHLNGQPVKWPTRFRFNGTPTQDPAFRVFGSTRKQISAYGTNVTLLFVQVANGR